MAELCMYGILNPEEECLYGYSTLADLLEAAFSGDGPYASSKLIRIDSYTVLAEGSDEKNRQRL